MTLSIYQPYDRIEITRSVWRAITRIRKHGAVVECAERSTNGVHTVLHGVTITGTGSNVLRATNRLDRILNPDLYR